MATDKSQPRMGVILTVGAIALFTLIAVHTALVSYFDHIAQAEDFRKVGSQKPEALINLRAEEKQRLGSGPMPIDKAMQMLSTKGRMGASPEIMPSASKDPSPLGGWAKMPGEVPPAFTATTPEPTPAPSASTSAAPPTSAAPSASAAPPHPAPSAPPAPAPQHP
jgi:hypothetical protein